ncbi:hypothetical protein J6590_051821 [Homalodisca vitripennis]|nr:hypothetical protein J6590_051821 [Homalodisca vitripennis]
MYFYKIRDKRRRPDKDNSRSYRQAVLLSRGHPGSIRGRGWGGRHSVRAGLCERTVVSRSGPILQGMPPDYTFVSGVRAGVTGHRRSPGGETASTSRSGRGLPGTGWQTPDLGCCVHNSDSHLILSNNHTE